MDTQNPTTIPNETQERWLPVEGFPGYEVSDHGRARSFLRKVRTNEANGFEWILDEYPQEILKPRLDKKGYLYIGLRRNGTKHTYRIHRLVLLAFIGPRPPEAVSRHQDGIRTHNHWTNLIWGTHQENMDDMILHDNSLTGERNRSAKLSEEHIFKIRELYAHGTFSQRQLGEMFNVTKTNIRHIVHRKTWGHLP